MYCILFFQVPFLVLYGRCYLMHYTSSLEIKLAALPIAYGKHTTLGLHEYPFVRKSGNGSHADRLNSGRESDTVCSLSPSTDPSAKNGGVFEGKTKWSECAFTE